MRNAAWFGRPVAGAAEAAPRAASRSSPSATRSRTASRRRPRFSRANDVLLIVGTDPAAIEKARTAHRRRDHPASRGGQDRARLHPRLRVEAQRGGHAARQPEDSGRLRVQLHPGAPGRHRSAAGRRPRARVRGPRRRAVPSRQLSRGAQLLWRFDQGRRRLQLHLHRRWRGDGPARRHGPAFRFPVSAGSRWGWPASCWSRSCSATSAARQGSCGRFPCRRTSCCETSG